MMLKVSHKCKLLQLQFTVHLKQLFFIIKANNMHINLSCSLNQYCSLKDMTSGQLCLNIDSIVICIRYQTKYMIHQYRPFSFQRVFDFVSSYEMRQKKRRHPRMYTWNGWFEYSRAESLWRDNVQALYFQKNGKQKCRSLACQLPVDVKFQITDLFSLIGSSFLYFFMNPIDISGESSSAIVNLKWCPLAIEPFLSSHILGRPSDELLVSELSWKV